MDQTCTRFGGASRFREGELSDFPGVGSNRVLVITDKGQPSWVLPDTIGRLYKHVRKTGEDLSSAHAQILIAFTAQRRLIDRSNPVVIY